MKKIFCAVLMMFVMCSVSFGASEDRSVYVRKNVFDAKMEILFTRLHSEIENLGTRLEDKIDALSERIDGLESRIDARIDSVERRINYGSIIGDIMKYLPFILISALVLMVYASIFFEERRRSRTPFTTVEDVKRLIAEAIAENSAKIRA